MKICTALLLALVLAACTVEPRIDVPLVEFSVEGKWMRKNTDPGIQTNFVSSTSQVKDEFLFYPQDDAKMLIILKRAEVEELAGSLGLIPETVESVVGVEEQFSRHFFSSTHHPGKRISVQFFKDKDGENEVVCTLKVKDPAVPNSLYAGFMVFSPDNALVWKQQMEDLLKIQ
jgi:hypothetical protein